MPWARKPFVVYLLLMGATNLAWEIAQLPLYTLEQEGGRCYALLAALHCTLGDLLIAALSLALAWLILARRHPIDPWRLLGAALLLGLLYTAFSEWLNAGLLGNWRYSDRMPLLPGTGFGLAPLLQWLVLPPACWAASRWLTAPIRDHQR